MMKRAGFDGGVIDEPCLRVGFAGCGAHALRKLSPYGDRVWQD